MPLDNIGYLNKFLLEEYGLSGEVTVLAGEIDHNYKLKTDEGEEFVIKVYGHDREEQFLDFQEKILLHLESVSSTLIVPKIRNTALGQTTSFIEESNGKIRSVRLLSWIDGRVWNQVNPHSEKLRFELGLICGKVSSTLLNFSHDFAHRKFVWDIAEGLWTREHLNLFKGEERAVILKFLDVFESVQPEYQSLCKGVIHNDANDFNCLVSKDMANPEVITLIDYGDAIYTQIINDVAISCSYSIMNFEDPLEASLAVVKGYHQAFPIEEKALAYLYLCIAIRLIISVTKSRLNKVKDPDNTYLQISDKSAWNLLLKWEKIDSEFAHYNFREACGLNPHPQFGTFSSWASDYKVSLKSLFPSLEKDQIYPLDLSVSSSWLGQPSEFNDLGWFDFQLLKVQKRNKDKIIAGGYLEPRPLYTNSTYEKVGNHGPESRCLHLGVDFWVASNTSVHTFLAGEVVVSFDDAGDKKYGGLIILRHQEEGIEFFTLYGHLSTASVQKLKVGAQLKKGDRIGSVGNATENGNWSPHLHFQIMLSLLDYKNDFPGVAYNNQKHCWKSICPDPNLFFQVEELSISSIDQTNQILKSRKEYLGKGMSLQYQKPLHIVRGAGVYLIDKDGRAYLDTVNNVAHVGHEHSRVVDAGQKQMGLLNTNSRYLHKNITNLAQKLKETLPDELSVFHFVNSGSEANELALRMVKAVTGSSQILVSQVGYHGNTNGCIEISSYKFDGKGGQGAPSHIHVFPMPDQFRGKYRGDDTAKDYSKEVDYLINQLKSDGEKLGGFIIEPILSCGGQVELPEGFLKKVYPLVRKEGGICISDEVQTGCGRMGKTFWGYELHGVIPDIITIGKPLGNGHPVAAVVCTEKVARKFANGMEFFNTFGGNPVSCAIAKEVLDVVDEEELQANAFQVGTLLKSELKKLAKKYPILASVRGQGLFLGIELVSVNGTPLSTQAQYLVNRMKENGILMSTDGPDNNVIKIKPPLVFSRKDARQLIDTLLRILNEDVLRN